MIIYAYGTSAEGHTNGPSSIALSSSDFERRSRARSYSVRNRVAIYTIGGLGDGDGDLAGILRGFGSDGLNSDMVGAGTVSPLPGSRMAVEVVSFIGLSRPVGEKLFVSLRFPAP